MLIHKLQLALRNQQTGPRALILAVTLLTACAEPYIQPSPGTQVEPLLEKGHAVMEDGYRLPLMRWQAVGNTRALVIALHGLNDYSFAFDNLGRYLAKQGITLIAYDQRGFGKTEGYGLWHGSERLGADLAITTKLFAEKYPHTPIYLLGESMGGAVVLTTHASATLDVDGVILLSPAVWTRDSMPYYQRFALWLGAHTLPAKRLTGEGLDIKPSDNIEMLRALARDELVIKATRIDVLYGISNLMDDAMTASNGIPGNILFLYGEQDEIIPAPPTCELFERLSSSATIRLTAVTYEQGYHMLTRDMQAEVVLDDIANWIAEAETPAQPGSQMANYCITVNNTD